VTHWTGTEPIYNCLIQVLGISDLRSRPSEGDLGPATRCVRDLISVGIICDLIVLINDFCPSRMPSGSRDPNSIADGLRRYADAKTRIQICDFAPFANRFAPTWLAIDGAVDEILKAANGVHFHFQINGGQAIATVAMILSGCSRLSEGRRTFWSIHPEIGLEKVVVPPTLPIRYNSDR